MPFPKARKVVLPSTPSTFKKLKKASSPATVRHFRDVLADRMEDAFKKSRFVLREMKVPLCDNLVLISF